MSPGCVVRFKAGVALSSWPLWFIWEKTARKWSHCCLIALGHVPGDSYSVPVVLDTGQGHLACVRGQSGLPGVVARA